MPAKGPVSIAWQFVLSILVPYFIFFAFYRIMRLRKMLVIFAIFCLIDIGLAVTSPTAGGFYDIKTMLDKESNLYQEHMISQLFIVVNSLVGAGVILYYLWRWSDDWNKTFQKEYQNGISK